MTYRPEIGYCAMNSYNRGLGAPLAEGFGYRVPSGRDILVVVAPGSIVRTSYDTGPYLVVAVSGPYGYEPPEGGRFEHWSLAMVDVRPNWSRKPRALDPPADSWINEVVAVDGRILALFEVNLDEVLVIERPADLKVPALQLGLAL